MMSDVDRCFVCGWTGHFGCHCPDTQCYGCDEFGHFVQDCPTRFLHQEHHSSMEDFIQDIDTPTPVGSNHFPIMFKDIAEITVDHSPTPVCTVTETTTLKGTPHTPLPATATACTTLQLMDAPTMIPTVIVALHPTLNISLTGTTLTTPWTEAALTSGAPTMQHKILSLGR